VTRCFLDTNVIFTAGHNPDGNGRALFKLAATRGVVLVSSRYAVEEAARNIALKYPRCIDEFDGLAGVLALMAEPNRPQLELATSCGLPD